MKRNPKVVVFTVAPKSDPNNVFTIVRTKDEAFEYVDRKLQADNWSHFNMWCGCHGMNSHTKEAWEAYRRVTLSPEDYRRYQVAKLKIPLSKVVAIMRGFFECVPLGCSFDDPLELGTLLKAVGPEVAEKIQKELEKEEAKIDGHE